MGNRARSNVGRLIDIGSSDNNKVEKMFLDDLKRSIEMTDKKNSRLPSKTFKPSSMQCKRNSYYQIIGEAMDDNESSFTMIGICNSGSDIHERIQGAVSKMFTNNINCHWLDIGRYVRENGLSDVVVRQQIGFETKLYNQRYNISFMCDGLIEYNGVKYILEIKTETSRKWFSRSGVDKKHYNQAIAYSCSLDLEDVIFLYVSRDTLDIKSYMFHVTDDMRKGLIDYVVDVEGYVDRHIAPPKDADIPRSVCNYCVYKTACRRDK